MSDKSWLIVNADDLGQSPGINEGTFKAHEQGIVTSGSLMVRWPAAREVADYARAHPKFSLGLHLDFGEWIFTGQYWEERYRVVPIDNANALADEVTKQIGIFLEMVGDLPTHIDSHQHMHRREPARSIVLRAAAQIPVRKCAPGLAYCGSFYGQRSGGKPHPDGITVAALIGIIENLATGWTEICCHPGNGEPLDSMYVAERAIEVQTLCDPSVREAIERKGVQLASYRDYRAAMPFTGAAPV
jgi:predicted glycoside hydrolase/deacetylase ChbG (UPF0249 family)